MCRLLSALPRQLMPTWDSYKVWIKSLYHDQPLRLRFSILTEGLKCPDENWASKSQDLRNSDTGIFICPLPWCLCWRRSQWLNLLPLISALCTLFFFPFLFHIFVSLLIFSAIWEHWSHLLKSVLLFQLKPTQNKSELLAFYMSSLGSNKINGTERASNF